MRSQSINIISGMVAFGVTGAGIVYLVLLALNGFALIESVSIVPPLVTGVTLAALVFTAFFVDSLMVYMSESLYLYRENMLRAKRAEDQIKCQETEPSTEVQQPVYQDTVPLNTARGSRELVLERPLTLAQIELGRALQALFLHAWNTGEDISSSALVGKGKPLSSTEAWGELTDYAHQMGFVSKGNGSKTVLVTTYETAVKGVWGRLSRVSVPVGYKAPKIAPPPQAAWSKIEQSERKAASDIKLSEGQ